jgi:hypothetical protein
VCRALELQGRKDQELALRKGTANLVDVDIETVSLDLIADVDVKVCVSIR